MQIRKKAIFANLLFLVITTGVLVLVLGVPRLNLGTSTIAEDSWLKSSNLEEVSLCSFCSPYVVSAVDLKEEESDGLLVTDALGLQNIGAYQDFFGYLASNQVSLTRPKKLGNFLGRRILIKNNSSAFKKKIKMLASGLKIKKYNKSKLFISSNGELLIQTLKNYKPVGSVSKEYYSNLKELSKIEIGGVIRVSKENNQLIISPEGFSPFDKVNVYIGITTANDRSFMIHSAHQIVL